MTSTEKEASESLSGQAPQGRAEPVAPRRAWRHSERLMPGLATPPLFAGVFALALAVEHPEDAVSVLYTIPIAIIAIERGPVAGLTAAAVALGLFAADVALSDDEVSALAFVTRGVGFGVLGGLLGHYATRL